MSTCVRCGADCGPVESLCRRCFPARRALVESGHPLPSTEIGPLQRRARCHPERPLFGRGLCRACWTDAAWRAGRR